MQEKELCAVPAPVLDTYALTVCALLTALSVVLARLLTIIPSEVSRFSLEAVPILLAGLLFGPLPGAAVGFAAEQGMGYREILQHYYTGVSMKSVGSGSSNGGFFGWLRKLFR